LPKTLKSGAARRKSGISQKAIFGAEGSGKIRGGIGLFLGRRLRHYETLVSGGELRAAAQEEKDMREGRPLTERSQVDHFEGFSQLRSLLSPRKRLLTMKGHVSEQGL